MDGELTDIDIDINNAPAGEVEENPSMEVEPTDMNEVEFIEPGTDINA